MQKTLYLTLVVVLLASPVFSTGLKLGAGAAGGVAIPVVQDDQSQGSIFGLRGRINVIPLITVEPNIFFTSYGDPKFDDPDFEGIASDLEGSKMTSYGVDGTFGTGFGMAGFHPYGVVGLGFYKVKNDQTGEDNTDFGLSGGLGFEFGLSAPVGIDLRSKLVVIPIEGGSKKSVTITGGLNYYFGK